VLLLRVAAYALDLLCLLLRDSQGSLRQARACDPHGVPSAPTGGSFVQVELFGGPCDGLVVLLKRPCAYADVPVPSPPDEAAFATYALSVDARYGRFAMTYISSRSVTV
jgi:hypothetical protein